MDEMEAVIPWKFRRLLVVYKLRSNDAAPHNSFGIFRRLILVLPKRNWRLLGIPVDKRSEEARRLILERIIIRDDIVDVL